MNSDAHVVIREFGYLLPEMSGVNEGQSIRKLNNKAFKYLQSLLYDESNVDDEHKHFLRPARKQGCEALQVCNYVGVLQTPCGTQIEILPKIHDGDNEGEVRNVLIGMLRYLRSSYFRESQNALLHDIKMPLAEVFFRHFLNEVNKLLKKGIRSDYVTQENNMSVLKGKLMLPQHIRSNVVMKHRMYIQYDEYLPDRAENRLIRSALTIIGAASRLAANQRLCRELMFTFDEVPMSQDYKADFSMCRNDRAMVHYQHVMEWCQLILNHRSPVSSKGDTNSISILFPMERIFEDYVAARLKQSFPEYQVRSQSTGKSLAEHKGKQVFALRPDLVIGSHGGCLCVADTKWKRIDQNDRGNKYGISQSDMYQLYAYARKYNCKRVMLIYPEIVGAFDKALEPFDFDDEFRLDVVPFPLRASGSTDDRIRCIISNVLQDLEP